MKINFSAFIEKLLNPPTWAKILTFVITTLSAVASLVIVLALQTALLLRFSSEGVNVSLFNTLTGIVVSLLSVAIGIYMILSANVKIKEIQKENDKNEQSI